MTRAEKQRAIDALKISAPVIAVTREEFNDYIQTLNKIMDWLEQEPYKVSEYDKDHIWYRGVQYISLRRFLEVTTEPKTKWIPVSERLPKEKDGAVLVTMPDNTVKTARYSEFSGEWYVGDMMGVGGPEPIAWTPLPEPYKAGKED